jgi:hypothetical protein
MPILRTVSQVICWGNFERMNAVQNFAHLNLLVNWVCVYYYLIKVKWGVRNMNIANAARDRTKPKATLPIPVGIFIKRKETDTGGHNFWHC